MRGCPKTCAKIARASRTSIPIAIDCLRVMGSETSKETGREEQTVGGSSIAGGDGPGGAWLGASFVGHVRHRTQGAHRRHGLAVPVGEPAFLAVAEGAGWQ